MNVYQNLEILKDPSFSAYLNEAEQNKQAISEIIFDKQKVIDINNEYRILDENNLDYMLGAIDEILCDEGYVSLCCAIYVFIKKDVPIAGLTPPKDGSLKAEFALMPPLFANIADICEDAIKRGVAKDFMITTLGAVNMYLNANKRRTGQNGTLAYFRWLPLYAKGKLFRIGAFQFEVCNFRAERAIGVHIPVGTKLDVKENTRNFGLALDFFGKYYSEYDFKNFVCYSWLMNPHVEAIMGKATNISRFGDMFERFEIDDESDGVFGNVFRVSEPAKIDELPEETSLQRNIKKFLKEGNRFKDYGGFISVEKILADLENM